MTLPKKKTTWQLVESYLDACVREGRTTFRHADLVKAGIPAGKATTAIQLYQKAQARPNCPTAYVIHRTGRTSNTVWHIGTTADDAREVRHQFGDDVQHRAMEAILPLLDRIQTDNPRARRAAMEQVLSIGRAIEVLVGLATPEQLPQSN